MTPTTGKTAKMLSVRTAITRQELTEEAQKLYDLWNDPDVAPEQKEIAKKELDEMIRKLEDRAETNRSIRKTEIQE